MIQPIPPAFTFIFGALLIPLLPGRLKNIYMLLLPVAGLVNLLQMMPGEYYQIELLNFSLTLVKFDRLARVFAIIFHLIAFISILYILNFKNNVEYVAGFIYAGSALGAIFAGDLITFFFFWEGLTVSSMFLILARKKRR